MIDTLLKIAVLIMLLANIALLSYKISKPDVSGVVWIIPGDAACQDINELNESIVKGELEFKPVE